MWNNLERVALNWFPLGTWTVLIVCLHCCFRRQKGWLMANAGIVRKLSSVGREAGGYYDDVIFVCTQTRLYDFGSLHYSDLTLLPSNGKQDLLVRAKLALTSGDSSFSETTCLEE